MKLDSIDRRLLELLQHNTDWQISELAEKVNLSPTPCWRRVQRLRSTGLIARQVALVDRSKVNLGVTVFVSLRTNRHTAQWYEKLRQVIEGIPEVVEFYRMSGDIDYLLRIVVPDIAGYDRVYKRLTAAISIADVKSSFALEEIKYTTALPMDYASRE